MARSKYGRRIAHGALLIGFASTCSTMMIEKCNGLAGDETAVSLGYDKVRFLGPVYIGDTVTLTYTIIEVNPVTTAARAARSRWSIRRASWSDRPAHPGLGQGQGVGRKSEAHCAAFRRP